MKGFLSFVIGIVVGVAGYWFFDRNNNQPLAVEAREKGSQLVDSARDTFSTENIKEEMSKTGQVIREKSRQAGDAISDATANARITSSIKAKLLKDSGLAALKVDVDTSDGVVTLTGTVNSYEQVSSAVKLAMETEGVHKVISMLQVKSAEAQPTPVAQ
jgi:hypothetical protein